MARILSRGWQLSFAILFSLLLLACSDSSDKRPGQPPVPPDPEPPEPELTYKADIVWTEYGIPHVKADDWGSLGYGAGYTQAKENFCTLMRTYVTLNGESARYFGDQGDIEADLVWKMFNSDERIQRMIDGLPDFAVELSEGFAAGFTRYLVDTGVDNLPTGPDGCAGVEWVRNIDIMDVTRRLHEFVMLASGSRMVDFIAAVRPPETTAMLPAVPNDVKELFAMVDPEEFREGMGMSKSDEIGSNAYAVGAEASQSNSGILFGNPHFPWNGALRFFMLHLTMGDELDVMGMAPFGSPMIVIGFNQNLAWTHTVSKGDRFTFYQLELNPENSLQYIYDGEVRDFDTFVASAEQQLADGSIETVQRTFYLSHHGSIVDLGAVSSLLGGWPNAAGTLLAFRDANLENNRVIDQFTKMAQSDNVQDFKESLRPIAIPLLNSLAADRDGDAFYGDVSVKVHVSDAKLSTCVRGFLPEFLTASGFKTLDGSDSECEWGSDEGAPEGVFGYDNLPKFDTREYAANANDSYWIPNPRNLIRGYPKVMGEEDIEQSIRTRHTFTQAERRLMGEDEYGEAGFNIDNIRQLHYQATNHAQELAASDVVDICSEVQDWSVYTDDPTTAAEACSVLKNWDGRHQLDSVGAHIYHALWQIIQDFEGLWSVPFTSTRPLSTPHTVSLDSDNVEAIRQALADAATKLKTAGIPMYVPWGEVSFSEKNGVRYGIHGGHGDMMFSNIQSELVDGEGYSNIVHGNSYIQAVTWDETECPDAYAILTYSQSDDPGSDHYADSTELYSKSGWIDMPFCEADRDEQEIGRESISE